MTASGEQVEAFIARWEDTGGGERANYQMFLTELCALIGVPGPDPSVQVVSRNDYVSPCWARPNGRRKATCWRSEIENYSF